MRSRAIPKWVMKKYAILWKSFHEKKFDFKEAAKVLKEKNKKRMYRVFSELNRSGWIEAEIDPKNSRKRIYQLKTPNECVEEILS